MITTFEKAIQKSTTRARRCVHHTSFLWASFAGQEFVRSTIHRPVAFRGAGLPFTEISAIRDREPAASGESPRSRSRDRGGC
jgi:hypothetical protein